MKPLVRSIATVIVAALCACFAPAAAQEAAAPDPLRPLLACPFGAGVKATSVNRMDAGSTQRMVNTAAGPMAVSNVDGYRVMFEHPLADPFVKLMIEQSAPGKIDADRAAIVAQMKSFSSPKLGSTARFVRERSDRGVDEIYFDFSELSPNEPSRIYTAINTGKGVVATVYFLGKLRDPAHRPAESEGKAAFDAFTSALVACLAKP